MDEGIRISKSERTSAPWVILVIHDNISLVGLIPLPSAFQISSTLEWHGHGQEDVECSDHDPNGPKSL